jgi:hypothetical protein
MNTSFIHRRGAESAEGSQRKVIDGSFSADLCVLCASAVKEIQESTQ